MSVCRLPSGHWRAQVYDITRGTSVSTARVLPGPPRSYRTKREAEDARAEARKILRGWAGPGPFPLNDLPPLPRPWRVSAKGETDCRACGAKAVHLHHIVPKVIAPQAATDIDGNGVPLCKRCHRGWHNRAFELDHGILTDHEFRTACALAGRAWVGRNYRGDEAVGARLARISVNAPQLRLVA